MRAHYKSLLASWGLSIRSGQKHAVSFAQAKYTVDMPLYTVRSLICRRCTVTLSVVPVAHPEVSHTFCFFARQALHAPLILDGIASLHT